MARELTVQFLVHGAGSPEEFAWALAFQQRMADALVTGAVGKGSGHDSGAGTINLFFAITDPERAPGIVGQMLRAEVDPGSAVAFYADDDDDVEACWPPGYPYVPSLFGPTAVRSGAEVDGLPGLAGRWVLTGPDPLLFMFGRDLMIVRRDLAVVSAARLLVHPAGRPRPVEIVPLSGPARGVHTPGLLLVDGDRLILRTAGPEGPMPATLDGPGRLELVRYLSRAPTSSAD